MMTARVVKHSTNTEKKGTKKDGNILGGVSVFFSRAEVTVSARVVF